MFFAGKFVLDLAQFAAPHGIEVSEVLDCTSLSRKQLESPQTVVDYSTIDSIFQKIKATEIAPNFGLLMGEQVSLNATAFLDQLMSQCSTVREAFEMAISYSRLISDAMHCELSEHEDNFRVTFGLNPDWALQSDYSIRQNLDVALLSTKNALSRLTQANHYPLEVNFHYPRPKSIAEHFRLFNCRINFGQPVSSIVFGSHLLEAVSAKNNHGLKAQLQKEAQQLISELPASEPEIVTSTKKYILTNVSQPDFSIDILAVNLKTTPRTLQRRLKAEGTSFKVLAESIRIQLINKLLDNKQLRLDEIAYLVGYSEPSALIRGYKKVVGRTPRK